MAEENRDVLPHKYDVNAKWDACLDLTVRRLAYSAAAGTLGGLLLFRTPVTRWAYVAFGAGLGLGSAYTECSSIVDVSPAKLAPYKKGFPTKLSPPNIEDSSVKSKHPEIEVSPVNLAPPETVDSPAPEDKQD